MTEELHARIAALAPHPALELDRWAGEMLSRARYGDNSRLSSCAFYAWTSTRRQLLNGDIPDGNVLAIAEARVRRYLAEPGQTPTDRLRDGIYEIAAPS